MIELLYVSFIIIFLYYFKIKPLLIQKNYKHSNFNFDIHYTAMRKDELLMYISKNKKLDKKTLSIINKRLYLLR